MKKNVELVRLFSSHIYNIMTCYDEVKVRDYYVWKNVLTKKDIEKYYVKRKVCKKQYN